MAHDVFLSCSNRDKAAADAVCHALERNRIRVWMAPRDVLAGVGWAQSIIGAINGARVMVLVFSANANGSPQIEREVERAVHKGIPVVPVRIEDVAPSEALEFFISAPHWLDAFPPPFEQHLDNLAEAVKRLLESGFVRGAAPETRPDGASPGPAPEAWPGGVPHVEHETPRTAEPAFAAVAAPTARKPPAKKRNWVVIAGALALLAVVVGGALLVGRKDVFQAKDEAPGEQAKSTETTVKRREAHEAAPALPSVVAPVPNPPSAEASAPVPTLEEQQTEFDEAMTAGTVEALDAFANKYPKSKLAKTAKRVSESIARQQATTKAESRGAENKPEPTPLTDCDRQAAYRDDSDKVAGVATVEFDKIDATRAVAACEEAIRNFPRERRFFFQYGRALMSAERYDEARKAYKTAIDAGSTAAAINLGNIYSDGWGVAKDEAEAVRIYRDSADRGNAPAMVSLGVMYSEGRGVAKDEAEAVRLYRKAADAGDATAMTNLGVMYEKGQGVAKDLAEAARLYRKAADGGDSDAMNFLGDLLSDGLGVDKNEEEAVRYYRKAVDAGNVQAMTNLGVMYASGRGVAKDEAEAVLLYRNAADAGGAMAMLNLGVMYENGRGVAKDLAEAARLYRGSADAGDVTAMKYLGDMYNNGRGVAGSEALARKYYRMAADHGDEGAKEALKKLGKGKSSGRRR